MSNLTLFVLGHEKEAIKNTCSLIKEKSYLKLVPVNLNDLDLSNYPENYNTKLLSENRFFLCDWNIQTEYIGIISYSWPKKFRAFNLNSIISNIFYQINEEKVLAPRIADKDWPENSEKEHHAGIEFYLKELSLFMDYGDRWRSYSLWCNTFFCHKNTYDLFLKDWRLMFGYLDEKYKMNFNFDCSKEYVNEERKAAYLLERATMMYFAQSNFYINQINKVKFL